MFMFALISPKFWITYYYTEYCLFVLFIGVASLDARSGGRIFGYAISYYLATTVIATITGVPGFV